MYTDVNKYRTSFSMKRRRILIYRSTLRAIGTPFNIRFLLNKGDRKLAVQACEPIDRDSFKVPDLSDVHDQFEITSIEFLNIVYKMMGWNPDKTFRVSGTIFPRNRLVEFDLSEAELISEDEFVDNDIK